MNSDSRIELLRRSPYFATASDDILRRIVDASMTRSYSAGERIFTEGDAEGRAALHFVVYGTVRIFKTSLGGREQVLRLMRPGDSFADVAAFDAGGYPASADALERSVVMIVPRSIIWSVLSDYPEMALGALQVMAGRLRHMTALVEDLSLRRVTSRVAKFLLEEPVGVTLNQSQIATLLGTSREMVGRSLHSLADDGVIALHGSQVEILDRSRLEEIMSSG